MTLTEHKIWHLPLILLALWLGACSMQYEDFDEPAFVAPGDITLVVNVHTGDRNIKATRADNNDGVSFEPTTLDWEKINTLRVIIVKKSDGLIVHNDYRDLRTAPVIFVNGLKYRVEYDTDYTVYLIGNEMGLSDEEKTKISDTALKPGETYTAGTLENIEVGSNAVGAPMITGTATPIPMTEIFTVETMTEEEAEKLQKPDKEGVIQNETFFITRAASKFSFYFFRAEDFSVEETDPWTISKIKVSGLGQNEFLFPNSTEYFPTKESDRVSYNRDIKAFKLPEAETYQTGDHTFTLPTAFNVAELPVKTGTDPVGNLSSEQLAKCQLIPEMYFPESKGTGYTGTDAENQEYHFDCTISFGNEDFLEAVKLPNLPHALPRNTHVVVIVTIHDRYITATVDVIPFTEVLVVPDYGLEREEFTGYVVGKDEEGRDCWYDGNYYESEGENDPRPTDPVPLYLGPAENEGNIVTINGKQYMLVYADFNEPIYDETWTNIIGYKNYPGYKREVINLNHVIEVFKDNEENETVKAPIKHMITEAGISKYDPIGSPLFLNNLKQRVILESIQYPYCLTLNEWSALDYGLEFWSGNPPTRGVFPKYWFDILGERYPWPSNEAIEAATDWEEKIRLVNVEKAKVLGEWVDYLQDQ